MSKRILILAVVGCLSVVMAACAPGSSDPAAPYYPTYTAIAQGLIDLANTATAQAAQPILPAESLTPPPPAGGTENVQQPDGTTKYSDYDAGFELVLPAGWNVVACAIPAVITMEPDGRQRLDFENSRPDEIQVLIRARR